MVYTANYGVTCAIVLVSYIKLTLFYPLFMFPYHTDKMYFVMWKLLQNRSLDINIFLLLWPDKLRNICNYIYPKLNLQHSYRSTECSNYSYDHRSLKCNYCLCAPTFCDPYNQWMEVCMHTIQPYSTHDHDEQTNTMTNQWHMWLFKTSKSSATHV